MTTLAAQATGDVIAWLDEHPKYQNRARSLTQGEDLFGEADPSKEVAAWFFDLLEDADRRLQGTDVGVSLVALKHKLGNGRLYKWINWQTVQETLTQGG